MQLEVKLLRNGQSLPDVSWTLTRLYEAERIGLRVGRAVRDFIRSTPLRIGPARLRLDVVARWRDGATVEPAAPADTVEDQPPKRKRRKAAK